MQHLQTSPPILHTHLHPKSVFYPTHSNSSYLEAFYRVVFSDFPKLSSHSTENNKYLHHNLHSGEMSALKHLVNNPDLIIKPADKGGGIVLQNRTDYITETNRLLSDSRT